MDGGGVNIATAAALASVTCVGAVWLARRSCQKDGSKGATRPVYSKTASRALVVAARRCDARAARAALADGADPDARGRSALLRPVLCMAAECEGAEIVKELLRSRADLRARDEEGWTALHVAAAWSRSEAADTLCLHGADVHAKDGRGQTPSGIAGRRNSGILGTLLRHGA
mmetsp:Transcript_20968/g.55947  ORF Transcript_20968/g.55947 Transcript_20968/m.55947 type:complete len:172 (-) Transcript_20968:334-849(-)